ncbi:hypothetical protein K8R33_04665 [archaeon]|nr:hypothetical protein [archaeon]
MKKSVIILLLLVLTIPFSIAKVIPIGETHSVEQTSEPEQKVTTYFYAGNKLLASKENDEIKYHYQDRLGTDINSKTLPFGQEIINEERFSFTGKELDEGLYRFGARYYDSNLGRFTSVDPVEGELAYGYVMNNPINLIDPSGESSMTYLGMAATIEAIGQTLQISDEMNYISKNLNNKEFRNNKEGSKEISMDPTELLNEIEKDIVYHFTEDPLSEVNNYYIDMTPFIGDIKGFIEGVEGETATGEKLNPFDRGLCILCLGEVRTIVRSNKFLKQIKKAPLHKIEVAIEKVRKLLNPKTSGHVNVDKGSRLFYEYNPETGEAIITEYLPSGKHPPNKLWERKGYGGR